MDNHIKPAAPPASSDQSLFLAVDGTSGCLWDNLTAAEVSAALTALTTDAFAAVAGPWAGLTPERVPVVIPLADGAVEVVDTTRNDRLRVWVGGPGGLPRIAQEVTLGSGLEAALITARFIAALGLPTAAASNAAA